MRAKSLKLMRCILLLAVFAFCCTAAAAAAPHLDWCTTAVDYDDGHMVIRGYFYNNGTRSIDRITAVNLSVYLRQKGSDWRLASSGIWSDIHVYLAPGDLYQCNLRINHPGYYRFDYYRVEGSVSYHLAD